jgi:hypothetical protein
LLAFGLSLAHSLHIANASRGGEEKQAIKNPMTNPTYLAACLEKFENERKSRNVLATCNAQLAMIAKFKRSRAWKQAGKALRESRAL